MCLDDIFSAYYMWPLVSVRIDVAENLDWRLFRVSDQGLIKWFGKSCRIFQLGWHLNWAMPNSLRHHLFKYNIALTPHCHESWKSFLLRIVNPTNMQWVAAIFNVFENYPGAHLGYFQYYSTDNGLKSTLTSITMP